MTPWPTAFTFAGRERLIVLAGNPVAAPAAREPGTVLRADKAGLLIACGGGTVYAIGRIQPEGRKPMDAAAFIAGGRIAPGLRLGRPPGD
jgi:methionyl-tRNA formyltransferase